MAEYLRSSRPVTLRARRDTIALVAVALGLTGALASAIHQRQTSQSAPASVWTGELSDAPAEVVPAGKPDLTSASLVVPATEMTLPKVPVPARPRVKGCDSGSCSTKAAGAAPVSPPRRMAKLEAESPSARAAGDGMDAEFAPRPPADVGPTRPGLIARFNPLGHLPDMRIVRRPLTAANETISGWFKRF